MKDKRVSTLESRSRFTRHNAQSGGGQGCFGGNEHRGSLQSIHGFSHPAQKPASFTIIPLVAL